jgi:hypothetical protein
MEIFRPSNDPAFERYANNGLPQNWRQMAPVEWCCENSMGYWHHTNVMVLSDGSCYIWNEPTHWRWSLLDNKIQKVSRVGKLIGDYPCQ